MDDDELTSAERARLDAWTPLAPPAGFVERVLGAGASRGMAARRRRPGQAALLAGSTVALAAAVAIVLMATRRAPEPEPEPEPRPQVSVAPRPEIDGGIPAIILEDAAGVGVARVTIEGRHAELRAQGGSFETLGGGSAWMSYGSTLRLGKDTHARLEYGGLAFDISPTSELEIDPGGQPWLNAGPVSVHGNGRVRLAVANGNVELAGDANVLTTRASVKIEVTSGTAVLHGANERQLAMGRGAVAVLTPDGAIAVEPK